MECVYVIGEDAISCSLASRIVTEVLGLQLAQPAVDTKGVTKLRKNLSRYVRLANLHPVLCIADTDGKCALDMLNDWLPSGSPEGFFLRFAVTESESWLMADRDAMANFLVVPLAKIPHRPDELVDPKQQLLNVARRSRRREIRREIVSPHDSSKPGSGYNVHLCDFVERHWRPNQAAACSPSLARALHRLDLVRPRTFRSSVR